MNEEHQRRDTEVDELVAEQRRLTANREAMADEIVAGQQITSLEEALRFARSWIVTAAQHAANEDYHRDERDKLLRVIQIASQQIRDSRSVAALETLRSVAGEMVLLEPEPPIGQCGAVTTDPVG